MSGRCCTDEFGGSLCDGAFGGENPHPFVPLPARGEGDVQWKRWCALPSIETVDGGWEQPNVTDDAVTLREPGAGVRIPGAVRAADVVCEYLPARWNCAAVDALTPRHPRSTMLVTVRTNRVTSRELGKPSLRRVM